MRRSWRQFKALMSIYIQDGLAYKASVFIWLMTDVVTAATMPLVMAAAAGSGIIQGFNASQFVVYYLVMLLVACFVQSHFMWEVAFEVKDGIFSSQIIRPVSYLKFMAARNLAWRVVRTALLLPVFLLLLWAYSGKIVDPQIHVTWYALLAVLLGHIVSFLFVMAFAMLALYLQETNSVFELYYVPMLFLSGQLFPVALFPDWVRQVALIFPFYYTTGVPTEMIIGRISEAEAPAYLLAQAAWALGSWLIFQVMFRTGTKRYAGVGM